jgi:hypothetical protein
MDEMVENAFSRRILESKRELTLEDNDEILPLIARF